MKILATLLSTIVILQPLASPKISLSQEPQPSQPYVTLVAARSERTVPLSAPVIIETKAKGDNLATILADDAVQSVVAFKVLTTVASMTSHVPGLVRIPLVGPAGQLIVMKLTQVVHNPTYTYIYALTSPRAATVVPQSFLSFRIHYSDVAFADPDKFQPVLIKVSRVTSNNLRIFGAQRTKRNCFHNPQAQDFIFLEDTVSAQLTKLGRGVFDLRPDSLPPGEYGIAIRPISGTYKISPQSILEHTGEGILIGGVWDFSVQ